MTERFAPFQVVQCERVIASAVGLVAGGGSGGDQLQLWYMAKDESCTGANDQLYIPFSPHNCQDAFTITDTNNPVNIDVPGTYVFRFVGANNPDVDIYVQRYNRDCGNG